MTQTMLQWKAPSKQTQPPVHKYVIESLELDRQDMSWTLMSEVAAISQKQYVQRVEHGSGKHLFRIVAWTVYGHSPYAFFSDCLPSPQPPSYQRMLAASASPPAVKARASDRISVQEAMVHGMKNEKEMARAGYWSVFVILVTIALRILTTRNIAILKCCLLSELEKMAAHLKLHFLEQCLRAIERRECEYCRTHCHHYKKEDHPQESHPDLVRQKAFSHKIEPTKHFGLDEASMVVSKSSPSLGDPKIDYQMAEWDADEATASIDKLPIPNYTTSAWDDSEGAPLQTQSSIAADVQVELVEGQCAFEG